MTITLRKQLGVLIGGLLVTFMAFHGVKGLAAPREIVSADKVSRRFVLLISSPDIERQLKEQGISDLISSNNQRYLNASEIRTMIRNLSKIYVESAFKTHKSKDNVGREIVRVVPLKTKPDAELVCVKERFGYKIDLVATYGRWEKLSGVPLAQRIYDISGGILPDLPRTPEIERALCMSNLKRIGLGMMMYVQDYDERYPLSSNWNQNLEPYLKDNLLYNCPTLRPASYGYAFNSAIESVHVGEIENVTTTVSFFDSQLVTANATGGLQDITYRHKVWGNRYSGANVAFTDGHVRFIPVSYKWDENRFTFTPKLRPLPSGGSENWQPLPLPEEP
jgi:prepilin-type processing-associated H-X9-DG protein